MDSLNRPGSVANYQALKGRIFSLQSDALCRFVFGNFLNLRDEFLDILTKLPLLNFLPALRNGEAIAVGRGHGDDHAALLQLFAGEPALGRKTATACSGSGTACVTEQDDLLKLLSDSR